MIGKSQEQGNNTNHAHPDAEDRGAGDTPIVTITFVFHGSSEALWAKGENNYLSMV